MQGGTAVHTAQTHKTVRVWGNNPNLAPKSSSSSVAKIKISCDIIWEKC